jgi:hypothetical protein
MKWNSSLKQQTGRERARKEKYSSDRASNLAEGLGRDSFMIQKLIERSGKSKRHGVPLTCPVESLDT